MRASDSATAKMATSRTMRAVSRSSMVLPVSSVASEAPMRPNSLRGPVAVTSARPWPRTSSVPENTLSPARLSTGSDSPVSSDSSAVRSVALISRASAGTRSPSARISRSPRTTSRPAMRLRSPSRSTIARGLERSRSASSARSALRSCVTVMAITPHDRGAQHHCLVHVAKHEVDAGGGDEQQEHRLAQHAERDGGQAVPPRHRQRVRTLGGEARGRLGGTQTLHRALACR